MQGYSLSDEGKNEVKEAFRKPTLQQNYEVLSFDDAIFFLVFGTGHKDDFVIESLDFLKLSIF